MAHKKAKTTGRRAVWNGLCRAGKHGLDFEGQPCDLCESELRPCGCRVGVVGICPNKKGSKSDAQG